MNGTQTITAAGRALLSAPGAVASGVAVSGATVSGATAADVPVHVSRYQARPGRRVLVIADLADLRGPADGIVELPIWLFWQANRAFDLGDPAIRRWVYQIVLREASRAQDLTRYLNAGVLRATWADLRLPRGVRRAWEELHPSLALRVVA